MELSSTWHGSVAHSFRALEMPKSPSFTIHWWVRKMFKGFLSLLRSLKRAEAQISMQDLHGMDVRQG